MSVSLPHLNLSPHAALPQQTALAAGERLQVNQFRHALQAAEAGGEQGEPKETDGEDPKDDKLRDTFYSFVGQMFFGQLLSTMRKTVGKPAYLHGGRGEEVFQTQMDQILVERMAETSSESFAKPMYELFTLRRE